MSFELNKKIDFTQPIFQFLPLGINEEDFADLPLLGGIFSELKHTWHAKGPCIEVRDISTGKKVGSWVFGGSIKDLHTRIICVDEIKAENGRLPLLMVALETLSGGQICVLDVFSSRVLRAINMEDQISSIHIVDSGIDLSIIPEPSPFRYFDGIVAVGTRGGNVYIVDVCRQICEDALENPEVSIYRDELYPCDMVVLPNEKLKNIKKYIERAMERGEHIGIHLNVVSKPKTDHFTLQGEKGEDRVYVNRAEVEVSSIYFSTQIASLLVGYNFGAFQLWDLRHVSLVYTSPICDDHIPITHFAVQEPADDPKAYCYIWVSYSQNLLFSSGEPYAVMYSFYYDSKKFLGSYGNLYENFQHCSVRFQIELGTANLSGFSSRVKGGSCMGFQSIGKNLSTSSLALCLISWLVWDSSRNLQTCVLLFDLNQWYKEQMPNVPDWSNYSNYIIKNGMNAHLLDVKLDKKSITQFVGVQKLEEHFCPTSLNFDVICMSDNNVLKIHNKSFQKALIDKLEVDGHLALCRPTDYYEQIISLGLIPIFFDTPANLSTDTGFHRELLLNMILEQKLVHWLCKCASKLSNDAFNSQGLPLSSLLGWAFQRAIHLKTSCDHFCTCLFDYSGVRLDTNMIALVSNSASQIKNICSFYNYVSSKLLGFICDKESLLEEQRCLENVTLYYEVLLWMVNIGLLPEGHNVLEIGDLLVAPYEVEELTKHYIGKRARLREASHQTFVEKDCLLFIDNLINNQTVGAIIWQHWQEDGGSGLYPPPSLQSALRIYLLDGTDLSFKHSLMTYTLLDIAVTLNENEKINIIKMLLKFPQIFNLSQSRIKIVQAFWHLDHDDYQTALDYILDPSVLSEDLQQWHHSVMMKSLLLQEQFTLALLYLQIRKPSLSDEKDLLTVLSLLISKNMLDEAFLFQHKHQSQNGELLLMHIFNECNKNEQLYSLLFRCLDNDEEKTFFKYLQTTKSPSCEDLKIFYYLLRSRFLEAFDTYSNCKTRNPETQGLIGQGGATIADNVVKLFKNLMPDVNKNLVEVVRKERSNLWKEVNRPTPLSVFALNAKEKVCYKSDVIFATLSKAKRTFNDSFYDKLVKDVNTESTPFLRTPAGPKNGIKSGTPILNCTIIEQDEYGPSPRKKLKLSPRSPAKAVSNLSINKTLSKITTPIVRRKLSMDKSSLLSSSSRLPHSILKGSRTFSESLINESSSHNLSLEKSRLNLRARKSVTPSKVKFNDLRYSSSSNEQSSPKISDHSTKESENVSNEETFYSPSSSPIKVNQDGDVTDKERCKTPEHLKDIMDQEQTQDSEVEKIVTDYSKHRMVYQSPKSRRSYKRSLGDSSVPVRSSPRLSQKFTKEESPDFTPETKPSLSESEPPKPSPSTAVQKLRGRRSLARSVLEHNTFSKTHITTYIEKSFSCASADSSCLSDYSFKDSSLDTEGDVSIHSPTPDASLIKLMKEYKDMDSKNTTVNESVDEDSNDDDEVVLEVKMEKDEELVTSEVKESNFTENIAISPKAGSDEEVMDIQASCYDPSIQELSKVEATEEVSKQNETSNTDENKGDICDPMDNNINKGNDEPPKMNDNDDMNMQDTKQTDINKGNDEPPKMSDNDDINMQDTQQTDIDNDALISAVYDDLSSGSEDLKDILQKNNVETEVSKSTSQSEHHSQICGLLVDQEKDESSWSSKGSQPESAPLDQGFTADVIEIGSSDDDSQQKIQHDADNTSSNSSGSNLERPLDESNSSNDSTSSNDSGSTEGNKLPVYYSDQNGGSNDSSSSQDSSEDFERNMYNGENSLDSQRTVDAVGGSKRERSIEIDEDCSRDSQQTEKMSNYDANDKEKDSDSDFFESEKVLKDPQADRSSDSQKTSTSDEQKAIKLFDDIEGDNVLVEIVPKELKSLERIEKVAGTIETEKVNVVQTENVPKEVKLKDIESVEQVTGTKEIDNREKVNVPQTENVIVEIVPKEIKLKDMESIEKVADNKFIDNCKNVPQTKEVVVENVSKEIKLNIEKVAENKEIFNCEEVNVTETKELEEPMAVDDNKIQKRSEHLVTNQVVGDESITVAGDEEDIQDSEEMETLKFDDSNTSSHSKETDSKQASDKTSKASQCTLLFPGNPTSEESKDNSHQDDQEMELEIKSLQHNETAIVSDDVFEPNDSVLSTPAWMKTSVKKTYSKIEMEERELNKTPVLKPVERTYLRRGRSTSQSLTFSGNESGDLETTSKSRLREKSDGTKDNPNISKEPETLQPTSKDPEALQPTSEEIKNPAPGLYASVNKEIAEKETDDMQNKPGKNAISSAEQSTLSNVDESEKPRRITRRMSANFEPSQASDSPTPSKLTQIEQLSIPGAPKSKGRAPKSKNSSQVSSTEETATEKSITLEETPAQSTETSKNEEDMSLETKPRKRLRSASVDQPPIIRTYSRKLRSKSIDEPAQETSSETDKNKEKALKIMLEPISEIPVPKSVGGKAKSDLGTYTTARRLTRTQAGILKAVNEVKKKSSKLPTVEEMDPINLLDKPPFQGDPDPEESKVYEASSPSSSSPSVSASQRSRRRSTSVVSDAPSIKPPSVTSKASKTTGIKSRLRTASAEGNSETSESPSPSKKTKKAASSSAEPEEASQTVQKSTRARTRTASVSSNTSNVSNKTNTSMRSTRSRKANIKQELPKIHEENISEGPLKTPVTSKRGRPRKKI